MTTASDRALPRVALIAPSGVIGGAERVYLGLLTGLADRGWQALPVLLEAGPLLDAVAEVGHSGTLLEAGRVRHAARTAGTIASLTRLVRQHDIDVVVANAAKAHLYSGPAAALARRPAAWLQTMIPDGELIDRMATRIPAAVVLCNSRESASAQRKIAPARRVETLHPGTDVTEFRPDIASRTRIRHELGVGPHTVVIGMIGRLQAWKNQHILLRALDLMRPHLNRIHLVFVGSADLGWEGDYEGTLKSLASSLGLEDKVSFTGFRADVADWTSAIDIAVNLSDREPFGLVVTEAMACEKAVVAVDAGGPGEIIENGVTGVLLPRADAPAVAKALVALVVDEDRRRRLGVAARRAVIDRYSQTAMVDRFVQILRSVIA